VSTKIYNGYRLPKLSLDDLNQWVRCFRAAMQRLSEEKFRRRIAELAAQLHDDYHLGPLEGRLREAEKMGLRWQGVPTFMTARFLTQHYYELTKHKNQRHPADDYEASLQVIPMEDCILVLAYIEDSNMLKAFEALEPLRGYAFWNNTDRPEGVSEAAWAERRDNWDAALGDAAPIHRGFTVETIGTNLPFPMIKDLIRSVPPRSERIRSRAENAAMSGHMRRHGRRKTKVHEIVQLFCEARTWLTTLRGQKAARRETTRLAAKLPRHPAKTLLMEPLGSREG
jgi:hypothetical protein